MALADLGVFTDRAKLDGVDGARDAAVDEGRAFQVAPAHSAFHVAPRCNNPLPRRDALRLPALTGVRGDSCGMIDRGCAGSRLALLTLCLFCLVSFARADPALWEVRDGGGAVRGWLFGAIHLCNAACYPLPPSVEAAFARAPRTAFELDVSDSSLVDTLTIAGTLPAGERLGAELSTALQASVYAAARQVGLSPEQIQQMRPWFASTLLLTLAATQAGYHPEQGIDGQLQARARADGKAVIALETARRQVDALSSGGAAAQHSALRQTVALIETGGVGEFLGRMVAAWRAGDDSALEIIMWEGMDADDAAPLMEALLDTRNGEMVERIDMLLAATEPIFVTVGAAHLVGEAGLPALLARRGWTVERRAGTPERD